MTENDSNGLTRVLIKTPFLTFSLSVIFSQIASHTMNVVMIFLVYHLTESNLAVSLLVMSFLLPQIFFSFLGGIIADAKNKRKVLLAGNLIRAVSVLCLFFFHETLVPLYIIALVTSVVTQFYVPAEAPMIPHLVRKEELLSANAVFGVSLFGSILIGYVVAGPAIYMFGNSGVFVFVSILYLFACLFVFLMPDVAPSVQKLRTEKTFIRNLIHLYKLVWKEFDICINILRKNSQVASSVLFLAISQVIILVLATVIPDYAESTLNIAAEDISTFVFAPAALGTITSSLVIGSYFSNINKNTLMNTGIIISSAVMFSLVLIDLQYVFNILTLTLLITFVAGIANSLVFIPTQTVIQSQVPDELRSKIYGILYVTVGLLAFFPIILAGTFADILGVKYVLLVIATLLLGLALGKLVFYRGS